MTDFELLWIIEKLSKKLPEDIIPKAESVYHKKHEDTVEMLRTLIEYKN